MRKPSPNVLLAVTLVLAIGLVAFIIWRSGSVTDRTARLGFQDADNPPILPENGAPDRRFDLLSAWDSARVPVAVRFASPLGPLSHVSGKFGEPAGDGGPPLPGDRMKGIGGGGTSLGDPVFAIADGLVLYAGHFSDEGGNVVVLGHRTIDGQPVQSLYAHLHRSDVKPGELVPLGTRIGAIGTADGHYPAHLHFQIHRGHGFAIPATPFNRISSQVDPSAFLAETEAAAEISPPSPLTRALSPDAEPWTALEIKGAERLAELPAGAE